jgi:Flp pilus assembly protein TadG
MGNSRQMPAGSRGQILVLFTVSLVAVMAMTGLVLDGGGTFAQRRSQQNAADAAALAAANTFLLTDSEDQARTSAYTVAATNGFTNGVNGTTIAVSFDLTEGARVTVDIGARHPNSFTPAIGIQDWGVATTATALAGYPDTAIGATPFIASIHIFGDDGNPLPAYSDPNNPYGFGETNGSVPTTSGDIAWTDYGTGNVNTTIVDQIIQGTTTITASFDYGQYIGQYNSGNHNTLYTDVDHYMTGLDVPVPVVDDNGNFQGWAEFHITGAVAGNTKQIFGYYEIGYTNPNVTVKYCAINACPRYLGTFVLKLVD